VHPKFGCALKDIRASTLFKLGCLSNTPSLCCRGRGATWIHSGANVSFLGATGENHS